MARISISRVLIFKHRIRIFSSLAILVLIFAMAGLIIKNPGMGKAFEYNSSTKVLTITSDCPNAVIFNDSAGTQIFTADFPCPQNLLSIGNDLNLTVTDGVTLTVASYPGRPLQFASINVLDNGKITHAGLTEEEATTCDTNGNGSILDPTDSQEPLCNNARIKKIDLEITGDLTLDSGGKIDAIGKGYPGSYVTGTDCNGGVGIGHGRVIDGTNYGWGPGGGSSVVADHSRGGGGGFGGDGAPGTGLPAGSAYSFYNGQNMEFGSGGGFSAHEGSDDDTEVINGGKGGGRIKIWANRIFIADSTSQISANGGDVPGKNCTDNNDVGGGGGAGGSVYVETNKFVFAGGGYTAASSNGGALNGGSNPVNLEGFSVGGVFQIFADGGKGATNAAGGSISLGTGPGGGGGWIKIKEISKVPMTIHKTLTPLERPGLTPLNNFNPYALQINDKIQVSLQVTNVQSGRTIKIKDELLTLNRDIENVNGVKCKPIAGTVLPMPDNSGTEATDGYVKWTYTAPLSGTVIESPPFVYNCMLEQ